MNNAYRPPSFSLFPPAVKNLLIVNGLFFLATLVVQNTFHLDLSTGVGMVAGTLEDFHWSLGLHYFQSPDFHFYQLITYMFMHAGVEHILFNMFALWMFGYTLENFWGAKRFLIFYFICGIGAGLTQELMGFLHATYSLHIDPASYEFVTIGASGAIFGILLAFGMLFPNTMIYVYFAIPVKAKYFVIFYGALELFFGIRASSGDNVAHFAHLGGMLFGFIMIMYWKRKRRLY